MTMESNLDLLQNNVEKHTKAAAVPETTVQNDNSVFIGEALNDDEKLNLLMTDTKPYITILVGFEGYGKTSFVATCYHIMLTDGGIGEYKFCDSDTLVGLERRSFLRRFNAAMESVPSTTKRTIRGEAHLLTFHLSKDGNEKITIFSDHSGEDFTSILEKQCETINSWNEKPDSLLFFIKKVPTLVLTESFNDIENAPSAKTKAPNFTIQHIYEGTQNVLLIKELRSLFPWKRIAIGLTSWDLHNSEEKPCEYLRNECPFLSNFINQYFPEAYIFGVSAQGWEYNEKMDIDDCMNKTMEGKRSYIIDPNGKKSYDITLPLDYLIS